MTPRESLPALMGDGDNLAARPARRQTRAQVNSASDKPRSAPAAAPARVTGRRRATTAGGKSSDVNSAAAVTDGITLCMSVQRKPPLHDMNMPCPHESYGFV